MACSPVAIAIYERNTELPLQAQDGRGARKVCLGPHARRENIENRTECFQKRQLVGLVLAPVRQRSCSGSRSGSGSSGGGVGGGGCGGGGGGDGAGGVAGGGSGGGAAAAAVRPARRRLAGRRRHHLVVAVCNAGRQDVFGHANRKVRVVAHGAKHAQVRGQGRAWRAPVHE